MTLHKLSAGDGYTYLTRQVAAHDATERRQAGLSEYYAERAEELAALQAGHMFCLSGGNLNIEEMARALLSAMPRISRAVRSQPTGFWHVYRDGTIKRMWP